MWRSSAPRTRTHPSSAADDLSAFAASVAASSPRRTAFPPGRSFHPAIQLARNPTVAGVPLARQLLEPSREPCALISQEISSPNAPDPNRGRPLRLIPPDPINARMRHRQIQWRTKSRRHLERVELAPAFVSSATSPRWHGRSVVRQPPHPIIARGVSSQTLEEVDP